MHTGLTLGELGCAADRAWEPLVAGGVGPSSRKRRRGSHLGLAPRLRRELVGGGEPIANLRVHVARRLQSHLDVPAARGHLLTLHDARSAQLLRLALLARRLGTAVCIRPACRPRGPSSRSLLPRGRPPPGGPFSTCREVPFQRAVSNGRFPHANFVTSSRRSGTLGQDFPRPPESSPFGSDV